jgi:hypothetical protein
VAEVIASKSSRAAIAAYAMCLVSDGRFEVTARTGVTLEIAKHETVVNEFPHDGSSR